MACNTPSALVSALVLVSLAAGGFSPADRAAPRSVSNAAGGSPADLRTGLRTQGGEATRSAARTGPASSPVPGWFQDSQRAFAALRGPGSPGWAASATEPTPAGSQSGKSARAYRFLSLQEWDDKPYRWNPCEPDTITWRFHPGGAAGGGRAERGDVEAALAKAAQATGLRFRYLGPTSLPLHRSTLLAASTGRAQTRSRRSGADLIVGLARPGKGPGRSDLLTGTALGVGGFTSTWSGFDESPAGASSVSGQIVSGFVVINRSWLARLAAGAGRGSRQQVLMHEIGHVLNLGHVGDRQQLMYPTFRREASARWGAGDLAGLRRVGARQGCLPGTGQADEVGRSEAPLVGDLVADPR